MTQRAVPISDISPGNWSVTPLYPKIDEPEESDSDFVSSKANPAPDSFTVKLAKVNWPGPGPKTVYVRLRKTNSDFVRAVVMLQEGDTKTIAIGWVPEPTEEFVSYYFELTQAQSSLIQSYNDLRLRVVATTLPISCILCPGEVPNKLYVTASNATGDCGCLNGVSAPVTYNPFTLRWEGALKACDGTSGVSLGCSPAGWSIGMTGACNTLLVGTSAYTCTPLSVTFTGVAVTGCCSGTIKLTVTA